MNNQQYINQLIIDLDDKTDWPVDWWPWLRVNMHVYREFATLALKAKRSGIRKWSAMGICEVIRWQTAIREGGQDHLKLNNNANSGLARLAMFLHPELKGFFQIRRPPANSHGRRLKDGELYSQGNDDDSQPD